MIKLPLSIRVHKKIPKEYFYKHYSMNSVQKEKFVLNVDSIFAEYKLTKENLNLTTNSEVDEIIILSISLRKPEIDNKVLEVIAKNNHHLLVFVLNYDSLQQLSLYHKGKIYKTKWYNACEELIGVNGFSLKDIWDNFIKQIALTDERAIGVDALSIDERLDLQEKILKLEKKIELLTVNIAKEIQPKKKYDKFTQLTKYKEELENIKHGKA